MAATRRGPRADDEDEREAAASRRSRHLNAHTQHLRPPHGQSARTTRVEGAGSERFNWRVHGPTGKRASWRVRPPTRCEWVPGSPLGVEDHHLRAPAAFARVLDVASASRVSAVAWHLNTSRAVARLFLCVLGSAAAPRDRQTRVCAVLPLPCSGAAGGSRAGPRWSCPVARLVCGRGPRWVPRTLFVGRYDVSKAGGSLLYTSTVLESVLQPPGASLRALMASRGAVFHMSGIFRQGVQLELKKLQL